MKKLLLIALFIIGCSSPTASLDPNLLVGDWVWTSSVSGSESDYPTINTNETMTFNYDNTLYLIGVLEGTSYSASGTWSLSGTTMTIHIIFTGETTAVAFIFTNVSVSGNVWTGIRNGITYTYTQP